MNSTKNLLKNLPTGSPERLQILAVLAVACLRHWQFGETDLSGIYSSLVPRKSAEVEQFLESCTALSAPEKFDLLFVVAKILR